MPRPALGGQRIVLNDTSRLNPTPVVKHWLVQPSPDTVLIDQLRAELKSATAARRPVAVGAARHSLGGQSLPRNGTAITFQTPKCALDSNSGTYRVLAGTCWRDVIASLDPAGFSPAVMQSNNDFGVASTFSVNAHGWPVPHGPIGSTVRSLRLMLADGTVLTCSRDENAALFALAMGGYGLFGIVIDLKLEMTENLLLEPRFERMPSSDFARRFTDAIETDRAVRMAYGRMSVSRDNFLEEAVMVTFRPLATPAEGLPTVDTGTTLTEVTREVYRGQIGSDEMKRMRWFLETTVAPTVYPRAVTRNLLLNQPVANLAGRDGWRTDILHEYFIPPGRFGDFVAACQDVIPRFRQEFLNVTLRYVCGDELSVLAYAPAPRIAAVMAFSQEVTPEAEADMMGLTENLIDRVLAIGGSFYLPYRLHARSDQLDQAYPNLGRFLERKRHYDPGLLFRNVMWDAYFAGRA
jgi:FAD/FMN-containing dehydrogenase